MIERLFFPSIQNNSATGVVAVATDGEIDITTTKDVVATVGGDVTANVTGELALLATGTVDIEADAGLTIASGNGLIQIDSSGGITLHAASNQLIMVGSQFYYNDGIRVFYAADYGMLPDTNTDYTSTLNALMQALYDAGHGGIIYFNRGTYRFDGQLIQPGNSSSGSTYPIYLEGSGAWTPCKGFTPTGGTIFEMRYTHATNAKLLLAYANSFGVKGICFKQPAPSGSTEGPFVQVYWASPYFVECTFWTTQVGAACLIDGFVFGSSTTAVQAQNFQGYDGVGRACSFEGIRRAVYMRSYANAIRFPDCTVWAECGGECAIEIDGPSGDSGYGNHLTGWLIEMVHYTYAAKITNGLQNYIDADLFDAAVGTTVAGYRCEAGAHGSEFRGTFNHSGTPVQIPSLSEATPGQNTSWVRSKTSGEASKVAIPISWLAEQFLLARTTGGGGSTSIGVVHQDTVTSAITYVRSYPNEGIFQFYHSLTGVVSDGVLLATIQKNGVGNPALALFDQVKIQQATSATLYLYSGTKTNEIQADNSGNLVFRNQSSGGTTYMDFASGGIKFRNSSFAQAMTIDDTKVVAFPAYTTNGFVKFVSGNGTLGVDTTIYVKGKLLSSVFADVGNVTTGETDLNSYTVAANQMATNGDILDAEYDLAFVGSATATRELKVYFGGTQIFDSGALISASATQGTVRVRFTRVNTNLGRYSVTLTAPGLSAIIAPSVGQIGSLDYTTTNIIKITGQAGSTGAATNDIVLKIGSVRWYSNA